VSCELKLLQTNSSFAYQTILIAQKLSPTIGHQENPTSMRWESYLFLRSGSGPNVQIFILLENNLPTSSSACPFFSINYRFSCAESKRSISAWLGVRIRERSAAIGSICCAIKIPARCAAPHARSRAPPCSHVTIFHNSRAAHIHNIICKQSRDATDCSRAVKHRG